MSYIKKAPYMRKMKVSCSNIIGKIVQIVEKSKKCPAIGQHKPTIFFKIPFFRPMINFDQYKQLVIQTYPQYVSKGF